jgi:hypothetical protein
MAMTPPTQTGLIKLSGKIENYKRTKGEANFMLTEADRAGMGVVALAAGLAGLSGQAISTAAGTGDAIESAHFVECTIDGTSVAGWVWHSPFKEGDEVEAAAYWDGKDFVLQGMHRKSDGIIALYPHCSRGRRPHNKNAFKWWFIAVFVVMMLFLLFEIGFIATSDSEFGRLSKFSPKFIGIGFVLAAPFFALMIYSMSRKWLSMVYAAESVFRTLGWSDPESIDLVKSSKQLKRGGEAYEYGIMYFRYFPES